MPPCPGPAWWWLTGASGLLLHWHLQLGRYSVFYLFIFLLVMLPSEIPKLPIDPPVTGFPAVWKLLFHDSLPRMGLCPEILCLSFSLYFLSYLILKRLVCLSGYLGLSTGIQKLFRGSCSTHRWSFNVFVGRKWSPHPIPPPSWDHLPLPLHFTLKHQVFLKNYYICSHLHWSTCTISMASLKSLTFYVLPAFSYSIPILILNKWDTFLSQPVS